MTEAAAANGQPPPRWRQVRRRTTLVVAFLEGVGAAAFGAILLRHKGAAPFSRTPDYAFAVPCAFIATSIVALLLWRMVLRRAQFSLPWAVAYGVVVVVAGSCLWGWLVDQFGMTDTSTMFVTATPSW